MDKKLNFDELINAVKKEVDLKNDESKLKLAACEGRIDLINEEFHSAYQTGDGEALAQNTEEKDELAQDLKDLHSETRRERIALEELVKNLERLADDKPSN